MTTQPFLSITNPNPNVRKKSNREQPTMITIGEISVDFLDVASREIAADIPVIPVQPGQKQPPLISGGTTSASTEPQQIEEWAKLFPDANVGVVCTLTGILIVDDDEGVVEQSGIPLNTRIVESSPGHRQYYFRHTAASEEVGNIPQRAGFSLRSHNYYGLAAGSRHPDGHAYKMLVDAPIQPMPTELLRFLQEKYATAKAHTLDGSTILHSGPLERKLGPGEGRNDDMTRLAGLTTSTTALSRNWRRAPIASQFPIASQYSSPGCEEMCANRRGSLM
jgi:hypothetical protein